jgi:hypothetical protein
MYATHTPGCGFCTWFFCCRIQTRQGAQLMDKRLVVAIDGWDTDSMYPSGHYVRTLGVIGDRDVETVRFSVWSFPYRGCFVLVFVIVRTTILHHRTCCLHIAASGHRNMVCLLPMLLPIIFASCALHCTHGVLLIENDIHTASYTVLAANAPAVCLLLHLCCVASRTCC